jgi:hypothetical protein
VERNTNTRPENAVRHVVVGTAVEEAALRVVGT